MANSITVAAPASGSVGAGLAVTGTVSPVSDSVSIALSTQNATLPTSGFSTATTINGSFAGVLMPTTAGTFYVWAWDQVTGLSSVSGALLITAPSETTVQGMPLSTLSLSTQIAKLISLSGVIAANPRTFTSPAAIPANSNVIFGGPIDVTTGSIAVPSTSTLRVI